MSTRLDFYSPSEVWTNSGCVGACVAAPWSWDTVARHCPRTPNRPWRQSSLQEKVRPPPIWKINNAGENLSAVSSLTTSTQPCPSSISASSFYILTLSAVFINITACFVLEFAGYCVCLLRLASPTGVQHESLSKPEHSNFIDVVPWELGIHLFCLSSQMLEQIQHLTTREEFLLVFVLGGCFFVSTALWLKPLTWND